jgi:hypothetical protein
MAEGDITLTRDQADRIAYVLRQLRTMLAYQNQVIPPSDVAAYEDALSYVNGQQEANEAQGSHKDPRIGSI